MDLGSSNRKPSRNQAERSPKSRYHFFEKNQPEVSKKVGFYFACSYCNFLHILTRALLIRLHFYLKNNYLFYLLPSKQINIKIIYLQKLLYTTQFHLMGA